MRTSFIRLVAGFVVLSWAALLGMGMVFARLQSWTDDRAKTDGVFLVHELLDRLLRAGTGPRRLLQVLRRN